MASILAVAAYFAPGVVRAIRREASLPSYDAFAHVSGASAVLGDGRILTIGSSMGNKTKNAERYDPHGNAFSPCAQMEGMRRFHPHAALLSDGRVLVAGGSRDVGEAVLDIEIYDPAQDRWSVVGKLPAGTRVADLAPLPGGEALIATEEGASSGLLRFTPVDGQFEACGHPSMAVNGSARLTTLKNGQVLVTHLSYGGPRPGDSNAFLYDPKSRECAMLPPMAQGRQSHTATLLEDGRVLVAGGADGEPSAEIFDPTRKVFLPAGPMSAPRSLHGAALLSDGRVLIYGGVPDTRMANLPTPEQLMKMSPEEVHEALRKAKPERTSMNADAEVYDPAANRFNPVPDPPTPLQPDHDAFQKNLPDGRLLLMSIRGPICFNPASNTWQFPSKAQAKGGAAGVQPE
jgi:hypothetical protein